MDETKLQETIDKLNKAFHDFKEANDKRWAEIESKGHADPLLDEKVDKANKEITELQAKLEEQHKENEKRMDFIEANASTPSLGGGDPTEEMKHANEFMAFVSQNPEAQGDLEQFREYKNAFNRYLRRGDSSLSPEYRNTLSVGSDPEGGYWVTPDTSGRIASLVYETSPMRQVANVVTIGTDALEGMNDLDEASSGGWVAEMGARSESATPKVGMWKIDVHEQYAMPKVTQKILDDAQFPVESWLSGKIADKISRTENTAFINGDGVGKPRGFLTYAAGTPSATTWDVISQTKTGVNGGFAASDPGDIFVDLVFGMKAAYRQGAQFMMSRSSVAEVRKLKDGQGNYLWQPNFSALQGGTLMGFPITEAEDMPVIGTGSLSIAFGNFNLAYQIVDRQGIRVLRDPLTEKGFVKFYTTKRVGGDVQNFEAIRLIDFSA